MSRKGCEAAPALYAAKLESGGRFAPLSRHKAAPHIKSRPQPGEIYAKKTPLISAAFLSTSMP